MEITLNHTIIPAHDRVASAKFYERILGFEFLKEWGHLALVRVNPTLTLDFSNQKSIKSHHYAFKVSDAQFDAILERIRAEGVVHGSGPSKHDDGEINHLHGGRGVYFLDPAGHMLEAITADYIID